MFNQDLRALIKQALLEDCPGRDITADLAELKDENVSAKIVAKDHGVFFGREIIEAAICLEDNLAVVEFVKNDGDQVSAGDVVCIISGKQAKILKVERVLLNYVQHLSGVATTTARFVRELDDQNIGIFDTRKTTPFMRMLEKKAVLAGGGCNHRMGLSDMILVKENHLRLMRQNGTLDLLGEKIRQFRQADPSLLVEIEVESENDIKTLDLSGADIIMLDNFDVDKVSAAVDLIRKLGYAAEIEVSGNINIGNIGRYRGLPVDRISVGCLTHSVKVLDLSLLI